VHASIVAVAGAGGIDVGCMQAGENMLLLLIFIIIWC